MVTASTGWYFHTFLWNYLWQTRYKSSTFQYTCK